MKPRSEIVDKIARAVLELADADPYRKLAAFAIENGVSEVEFARILKDLKDAGKVSDPIINRLENLYRDIKRSQ